MIAKQKCVAKNQLTILSNIFELRSQQKEKDMSRRKSLPDFQSYEEASEWLDTHSTGDLYAQPVRFTVSPNLKVIIVDAKWRPIKILNSKHKK